MQKRILSIFTAFVIATSTGSLPAFAEAVPDKKTLVASTAGFTDELGKFEAAITAYGESAVTLDGFIKLLAEREATVATAQAKIAAARAAMRDPIQQLANFPNNSAAPARQAKVAEQVAIMLSAEAELIEAEKARDGARHVLKRVQATAEIARTNIIKIAVDAVSVEQGKFDEMAERANEHKLEKHEARVALRAMTTIAVAICNDEVAEDDETICDPLEGQSVSEVFFNALKAASEEEQSK